MWFLIDNNAHGLKTIKFSKYCIRSCQCRENPHHTICMFYASAVKLNEVKRRISKSIHSRRFDMVTEEVKKELLTSKNKNTKKEYSKK